MWNIKTKIHNKTLSFPVYFWTVVGLTAAGLATAAYLAVSHYRVYTDMGYRSFCAISRSFNCDTVSQSPFAIFLNVPVAVWGVVGYAFFMLLLYPAYQKLPGRDRLWPTLFAIALCFSSYSVVLSLISTKFIRSYCLMCIVSYAVNFSLLYFSWLIHRRFGNVPLHMGLKKDFHFISQKKKAGAAFITAFIVTVAALILFFPAYWKMPDLALNHMIPSGFTEEGHPWIGAENPRLVITEFTDYQCFQCKKMHLYLRQLVSQHSDKLRLIHRHFPMDHVYNPIVKEPYHTGSGKMALLSLYAAEMNNFWEINDMLFNIDRHKGHFNIREMARIAEFDLNEFAQAINNKYLLYKLSVDIREGMRLGITGTPAYLISGNVYMGHIPPEILAEIRE